MDALVEALSDAALVALTDCYLWRNNGVPGKLRRSRTVEFRTVAVSDVTLSDAESELKPVFRELSRSLERIATDPRVLAADPYSTAKRHVDYPVLLAEPDPEAPGRWRVLDGIHRAVQLYWNGDREIALCEIRP